MPRLNVAQETEIVRLLAAFHTPSAVVVRMRESFGINLDRSQVIRYDPTKASFEGGDRWREIFLAARRQYLSELDSIPITHAAFRLNELQNIYVRAGSQGNLLLQLRVLTQAAQESQAIPPSEGRTATPQQRSEEEQIAMLGAIFDRILCEPKPE